jgi:hypothetical protein
MMALLVLAQPVEEVHPEGGRKAYGAKQLVYNWGGGSPKGTT